jgi:hypothetical protein
MPRVLPAFVALLLMAAGCSSSANPSTGAPPSYATTASSAAPTVTTPAAAATPTPTAAANPLSTKAQVSVTSPAGYSMTIDFTWAGAVASDVGSNPPGKVDMKVSEMSFAATLTNTTVGGRTMPVQLFNQEMAVGGLYAASGPACAGLTAGKFSAVIVHSKQYCFIQYDTLVSLPVGGALGGYVDLPSNTPIPYTPADLSTTVGFGTGTTYKAVAEAGAPAIVKDLDQPLAVAVLTGTWKPSGAVCSTGSGTDKGYFALLNGATAGAVPGCAG